MKGGGGGGKGRVSLCNIGIAIFANLLSRTTSSLLPVFNTCLVHCIQWGD